MSMGLLSGIALLVLVFGVGVKLLLESAVFNPTWDDPSLVVNCASSVKESYNRGNVTDFPGECFFTDSYEDARQQFKTLAKQCGAELFSLIIDEEKDLTTDVAILRRSREKVIIHISGTHGVEGFTGSAIQGAALHQLLLQPESVRHDASGPTLLFVHALNPYGMKYNRRVNEENIDLNRNFLTDDQLNLALGRDPNFAHYVDAMDVLSPSHPPFPDGLNILNDLKYLYIYVKKVLIGGMMKELKRALVSGNYHFPKGLGYGGQGKSRSFVLLENFLKSQGIYNDASDDTGPALQKIVLIDVHTGLGLPGVDALSNDHNIESQRQVDHFEFFFPEEKSETGVVGGMKSTAAEGANVFEGYDLMMGDVDSYCSKKWGPTNRKNAWRDKVCTIQEFGTYSSTVVGQALISENHMFHYGSEEQRQRYGFRLKKVFYIRNKKWTRSIVHRGMEVLLQAIDFVNS